jgi:hypothetical protein
MVGLIHVKGENVKYRALITRVIPSSREHYKNPVLAKRVKPISFRKSWKIDPKEPKTELVMTQIKPISINTLSLRMPDGRPIKRAPQKYAQVIVSPGQFDPPSSARKVSVIHTVCNRTDNHGHPLNVRGDTATHFISGFWSIKRDHLRQGVTFALHRSQKQVSFLQGTIEDVEEVKGKRVEVVVRKTAEPLPWIGSGARGRAYEYAGTAITHLKTERFVPPDVSEKELGLIVNQLCVLREGQPEFRKDLLRAYQTKCAVTECEIDSLLEAAHILPYKEHGKIAHHVQNGLLLRADIHVLFDRQLIAFRPRDGDVHIEVSNRLKGSGYENLDGQKLHLPIRPDHRPSRAALNQRMKRLPKL